MTYLKVSYVINKIVIIKISIKAFAAAKTDLQLTPLVELCVPEADAAELEVLLEDGLVVGAEVAVVGFVDDLATPLSRLNDW